MFRNQNHKSQKMTSSRDFKSFDLKPYQTLHFLVVVLMCAGNPRWQQNYQKYWYLRNTDIWKFQCQFSLL